MRALLSILLALVLALVAPMTASAVEEPDHEVVAEDGRFEIRAYEPMIVAEVEVTGEMGRASNSGFRFVADYIYGNNTAQAKIDMTAPVVREQVSQKIDMTAPVLREPAEGGNWMVAFIMPSEWTIDTLPTPNNPAVTLREVPGEVLAAAQFRGGGSMGNFARREAELRDWIEAQGYEVTGPARYAGYSGPWVPDPMKREEVLIPVAVRQAT